MGWRLAEGSPACPTQIGQKGMVTGYEPKGQSRAGSLQAEDCCGTPTALFTRELVSGPSDDFCVLVAPLGASDYSEGISLELVKTPRRRRFTWRLRHRAEFICFVEHCN